MGANLSLQIPGSKTRALNTQTLLIPSSRSQMEELEQAFSLSSRSGILPAPGPFCWSPHNPILQAREGAGGKDLKTQMVISGTTPTMMDPGSTRPGGKEAGRQKRVEPRQTQTPPFHFGPTHYTHFTPRAESPPSTILNRVPSATPAG